MGERLTNRDRQRIATRERVFEAALAEFRRVGSAHAQIEDIVRRAGVAAGTFYHHFGSKEEVIRELRRRLVAGIAADLLARLDRVRTLEDLLTAFADAVLVERPPEDLPLEREAVALLVREGVPEPDWETAPPFAPLTAGFRAARERGEIAGDLEPVELTQIFATCLFGHLAGMGVPTAERRERVRRMIALFLRGIRAPADSGGGSG